MADGEDEMQLPHLGDIAQELPAFEDENGFEPVSPGIILINRLLAIKYRVFLVITYLDIDLWLYTLHQCLFFKKKKKNSFDSCIHLFKTQ